MIKKNSLGRVIGTLLPVCLLAMTGCGTKESDAPTDTQPATDRTTSSSNQNLANLSGKITIDGSSTVFPITEAVAEEFQKLNKDIKVTVGISGTGGGFKKFVAGETDISNASRPIEQKEIDKAATSKIEFIEIPVAYDGLTVVVNPQNTWCDHLTLEELKKIWAPESKIKSWKEVRAGFPDVPLKLYGAGTDSGTFDYFTKAIVGKEKSSRSDYQSSEDDNTLVTGIIGDKGALGYFGYAYFDQNKDKLKALGIDNGKGPVKPSLETIIAGTYQPLARPEFIYVSRTAADRPEVQAFVKYYLSPEGRKLVKDVGYVPLTDKVYEIALQRFEKKVVGTLFGGTAQIGVKLEDLLKKEGG